MKLKVIQIFVLINFYSACSGGEPDQFCAACKDSVCKVCYESFLNNMGRCIKPTRKVD